MAGRRSAIVSSISLSLTAILASLKPILRKSMDYSPEKLPSFLSQVSLYYVKTLTNKNKLELQR